MTHKKVKMRLTVLAVLLVFGLGISNAFAQTVLKGVVTDSNKEPLIGVNVVIKGTTQGTVTDMDGNFQIRITSPTTLVVTYIGYTQREISVNLSTKPMKVVLEEASTLMQELVVVGYGSQTKATVTGAINSIKSEEILQTPVANLSSALAGRTSGLMAIQQSGEPGNDKSILKIRGVGTLRQGEESDPLVLVDGVQRDFNEIDPNEIESINVLKDASATAVFGVRGANGVILVTTKTGREGKPSISITANAAVQSPTRLPRSVDSYTYAMLNNEARVNDGKDPMFLPVDLELFSNGKDPYLHPNINWYDELVKPLSFQQQYNINVSGGVKRARYFISLGYFSQDGAFDLSKLKSYTNTNTNYNRYNFRSNLDFELTTTTQVAVKLGSQLSDSRYPGASSSSIFNQVLSAAPISTPGIIDGKLIKDVEGGWKRVSENPFYSLVGLGWYEHYNNSLFGNLSVNQKLDFITKGLSARAMISYDGYYIHTLRRQKEVEEYSLRKNIYTSDSEAAARNPYIFVLAREEGPIRTSEAWSKRYKYYAEGAVEYNRTFGKHTMTGLVLANMQKMFLPSLAYGLPSGYLGLVGRITYNYAHKYLAEVNVGYNGSENFPEGKRFGVFPAASLGWVISKEDFFPENDVVTFAKVRGSYGEVGNDKLGGDRYMYRQSVFDVGGNYFFGENLATGKFPSVNYMEGKIGNPNVTWERARKSNIGVELKFLRDKLSFTGDLFYEYRDNILWVLENVPITVQAALQPMNIGIVENKGFDMDLTYNDTFGKFDFWAKGNFSFSRNQIIYKSEVPKPYIGLRETGYSVGQYKGLVCLGFYNTQEELDEPKRPLSSWESKAAPLQLGDLKYKDVTGDGVIDDNDRMNIGYSSLPELMYGLSFGATWRGIELSMLWQGVGHVSTYLSGPAAWPFYSEFRTAFTSHEERWTKDRYDQGLPIMFPRLSSNPQENQHNYRFSSFWLQDASYLRLKNIELAYRLPGAVIKPLGVRGIRVYLSAQNLITFTDMKNFDPEAKAGSQGFYPQMRIFNVGLNLQF